MYPVRLLKTPLRRITPPTAMPAMDLRMEPAWRVVPYQAAKHGFRLHGMSIAAPRWSRPCTGRGEEHLVGRIQGDEEHDPKDPDAVAMPHDRFAVPPEENV